MLAGPACNCRALRRIRACEQDDAMTGELSPAGQSRADLSPASQAAAAKPEIRVSHADRDRVVDVLRVAAGDGRLTAEELDERLEAALTARTERELAVLTA